MILPSHDSVSPRGSLVHQLSPVNQNCTISAPFLIHNLPLSLSLSLPLLLLNPFNLFNGSVPTLTPHSMFNVRCFHCFHHSIASPTMLYKLPIGPDSSHFDFPQLPLGPDSSRFIPLKTGPTGTYRELSGPKLKFRQTPVRHDQLRRLRVSTFNVLTHLYHLELLRATTSYYDLLRASTLHHSIIPSFHFSSVPILHVRLTKSLTCSCPPISFTTLT